MPTSHCRFPQHHDGPSSGGPVALVLAILAGAGIIAYARTVIVLLAVCGVLVIVAAAVMTLWHSAHAAPYDAAYQEAEHQDTPRQLQAGQAGQGAPVVTQVVHVHADPADSRAERLEAEVAALRGQLARQIEAPAQHLHLHGLTAADVAELVARQASVTADRGSAPPPLTRASLPPGQH